MSRQADIDLALEHLLLRLRPVNRALRRAAEMRTALASRLSTSDRSRACITAKHASELFAAVDGLALPAAGVSDGLAPEEQTLEARLRARAARSGAELPLDLAATELELSPFEQQAIVICAAPELDQAYSRLYAYVHDDLNRLAPSLELICSLDGGSLSERTERRRGLARHGRLCRYRLLDIVDDTPNALNRTYALGPGVFEVLTQPGLSWQPRFGDPAEIDLTDALPLEILPDGVELCRLADALRRDPACLLGIWGRPHHGPVDVVRALAARAGSALRELSIDSEEPDRLAFQISRARALDAALWLDVDALDEGWPPARTKIVADQLSRSGVPLLLSGRKPWHPLPLLARRNLLDLHLTGPTVEQREQLWSAISVDVGPEAARALAERYQLSPQEMRAAVQAARARSRLEGNGRPGPLAESLPGACRSVVQRQGARFASLVTPKRKPDQLILPAELHRRVIEVAGLFRHAARVDDIWGFGRMVSGAGGMRVLMTGESGTGKSVAAEVIAGQLDDGPTLLKVDLASVVSKWVGETEKNLEAVFQHAEESHCVLFFDEADALFSKRGEVQRGADRYSNLEVGYLLQRLEEFAGLAILATNHRDQLDQAFTRRFQVVLHLPRPGPAERRRLWRLALPADVRLDADVDKDALDQLDLTGAGITSAARTAALLAADSGSECIGMPHLMRAVARQFQNEARLLPVTQIGRYAALAAEPDA